MAHNLAIDAKTGEHAMFSLKEIPWHGLGQIVEEAKTSDEVIKLAHLDWEVAKVPNYIKVGDQFIENGSFSTVRTDTNEILGNILLKGYTPMQNKEVFEFSDSIVMSKEDITYETAGALGKGETIFVSAKLPGYIRIAGTDDIIEKYLLIYKGHSGAIPFTAQFTNIRVVCNNTLSAAMAQRSHRVYIRHTANAAARLSQAKEILGLEMVYNDSFQEALNRMSKVKVTDEKVKQVIHSLFMTPDELKLWMSGGTIGTRKQNGLDLVFESLEVAPGQDLHKGTALWLFNGVTSYMQNVREYKTADRKMGNLLLQGWEQATTQKAFNLLSV